MKYSKISLWWTIPAVYLILLASSWGVQHYFPITEKPYKFEQKQQITDGSDEIELRYYHLPGIRNSGTVLLVPDVLYANDFILPLAHSLQQNYDVIIPHYPDSATTGKPVSHSVRSRANQVQALLETVSGPVHVIGHGYGGLVAAELLSRADHPSENIMSLTLLSSFGVQELNFLGNHTLNKSLYSLLYPVVGVYKYAVPHFGSFYRQPLNSSYVRSKTEMDQRSIREKLQNIDLPALVLHAQHDRYVPLATGVESHRLLAQSYFVTEDARHWDIEDQPQIWVRHLNWFFNLVQNGYAPGREQASAERIAFSQEPFDADEMETIGGWALVIIILLLALSTLISEDLSCIAGGLVVASGLIDFWFAVLGCFLGILIADVSTYFMGRWVGRPVLNWIPFRWLIKKKDMQRIEQMFEMRGVEIIFVTRFLPGTRFPAYLAAGILETDFKVFLGYFVVAIALWTPMLVGISAIIGQPMIQYLEIYQDYALWIVLGLALMIYSIIKIVLPLATVKGRREVYVKWHRMKEKYL